MWKEFKEFIARGNVVDLAVAFVMGAAFAAITNSLVNDIIMPIVGVLLGGIDFSSLSITIGSAVIQYGRFIQAVVTFLIIAVVMFFVVKASNKAMGLGARPGKSAAAPESAVPPPPTPTEELLTEIRDLLRAQAALDKR